MANAATDGTTTPEAEQLRQVIRGVVESVDARRWKSLTDLFAQSVFVDYTSLFGGSPRSYTADDLADNWRGLLEPFSATRHALGPIAVEGDEGDAKVTCPVRISHFLRGAPGGEEWVVVGQFVFTLERHYGEWRVKGIVLGAQSQEGNTNLLVEAFALADKRLPCKECGQSKRAQQVNSPSNLATNRKPRA
jgi:hypothetical protein